MLKKLVSVFRAEPGFWKMTVSLALPIAFQTLLTSCAAIIDTAMVVSLGNAETSAIGVAARFAFLLNIICFGFISGCAALISQYWGAHDVPNVRRSYGLAILAALSFGVLYTLALGFFPETMMRIFADDPIIIELGAKYLRYYAIGVLFVIFSQVTSASLRATQRVVLPLICSAIGVAVNCGLNYCLIFGNFGFPRLELEGAAIATVASAIAQTLFLICAVLLTDNPFRTRLANFFAFSRDFAKKYIRIASPALLNEALWGIGTNVYIMVFARQGIEEYAGYTLYENVQQLFFVFFCGICGACAVIVGMRIGAGDHEGGYEAARRFAVMTPLAGVVLGAILFLVRTPILSMFAVETEYARDIASQCLAFYSLWIGMRMIPYTLICGIFRAGGDTKMGCILDIIGLWGCGVPAVLIVGLLVKPSAFVVLVIAMFLGEDTLKSILCLRHFVTRKWIKQITEPEAATIPETATENV